MVEKETTNLLLEKNLKDLAKARNISISALTNSALATHLALPNSVRELDAEEHKLKEEMKALTVKRAELKASGKARSLKSEIAEMDKDVKTLQRYWIDRINGMIKDDIWAKVVTAFCERWKVDRAVALQYAEGKKEVR